MCTLIRFLLQSLLCSSSYYIVIIGIYVLGYYYLSNKNYNITPGDTL